MMTFLTVRRSRQATGLIALVVIAVAPGGGRCAIPPPVDTIIQTTTSSGQGGQPGQSGQSGQQQPGAPAPPPFTADSYPPGGGGGNNGGPKIADVPEPASLVLALVGSGLAGMVLWNRRGQRRKLSQVAL